MLLASIIAGMILYATGVLTGVYVGFAIKKEVMQIDEKRAPSQEDREKILTLATDKKKITNDDVQALLKVSDSTAQRYLKKLVSAKDLTQHGKTTKTYYTTVR